MKGEIAGRSGLPASKVIQVVNKSFHALNLLSTAFQFQNLNLQPTILQSDLEKFDH
jgi:hypothetical protein